MSAWAFSADGLARLAQAGRQPPLRPRLPLFWQGQAVGSVEPDWLALLAQAGGARFFKHASEGVHCQAPDDAGLADLARCMHEAQLAGPWRSELLEVLSEGRRLGLIERGAVRPLSLATQAVHLVGQAPDGRMWVQRRALSKPNDPGLNDTLMGGMVAAADGLEGALARETWEEAGLRLAQLQDVRYGGQLALAKPSRDGQGMGYMRETLHWYCCTVPEGVVPSNQDGEVDEFELLGPADLVERLQTDCFTTEAALVLLAALKPR